MMNNELLDLVEKQTDILIQQSKTHPQLTFDFKMNKQIQFFSFNPPKDLVEQGKWFLAVTHFEGTNAVFIVTKENNRVSISIPVHWNS